MGSGEGDRQRERRLRETNENRAHGRKSGVGITFKEHQAPSAETSFRSVDLCVEANSFVLLTFCILVRKNVSFHMFFQRG